MSYISDLMQSRNKSKSNIAAKGAFRFDDVDGAVAGIKSPADLPAIWGGLVGGRDKLRWCSGKRDLTSVITQKIRQVQIRGQNIQKGTTFLVYLESIAAKDARAAQSCRKYCGEQNTRRNMQLGLNYEKTLKEIAAKERPSGRKLSRYGNYRENTY